MAKIQVELEINDEFIKEIDRIELKSFLEQQLKDFHLLSSARIIKSAIDENQINLESLMKESKKEAWFEYKEKNLKGLLP